MEAPSYGFETKVEGVSMDEAVRRVTEALKVEGFGVLTTIDIQNAFEQKLGVDYRPYVILGACNPKLAHKALGTDPYMGLLLPCNVVVQQMPGDVISIAIADPAAMFEMVQDSSVEPIAAEARERLGRVLEALGRAS